MRKILTCCLVFALAACGDQSPSENPFAASEGSPPSEPAAEPTEAAKPFALPGRYTTTAVRMEPAGKLLIDIALDNSFTLEVRREEGGVEGVFEAAEGKLIERDGHYVPESNQITPNAKELTKLGDWSLTVDDGLWLQANGEKFKLESQKF